MQKGESAMTQVLRELRLRSRPDATVSSDRRAIVCLLVKAGLSVDVWMHEVCRVLVETHAYIVCVWTRLCCGVSPGKCDDMPPFEADQTLQ